MMIFNLSVGAKIAASALLLLAMPDILAATGRLQKTLFGVCAAGLRSSYAAS